LTGTVAAVVTAVVVARAGDGRGSGGVVAIVVAKEVGTMVEAAAAAEMTMAVKGEEARAVAARTVVAMVAAETAEVAMAQEWWRWR